MIVAITIVVALLWLQILKRTIPYYADKNLPTGLLSFFLFGLLSVPVLMIFFLLLPGRWMSASVYTASYSPTAWRLRMFFATSEEFAKWIVFALMVHWKKPLRSPEDGVLFAAATSLAFATVENISYGASYGFALLMTRSVLAVAGHMSCGALWGFGWAVVTWEEGGRISWKALPFAVLAVLPAGLFHGLYNESLWLGREAGHAVQVILLLIVFVVYQYLLQRSPYRSIPFRESERAIRELTKALSRNEESVVLLRRRGFHLLREKEYARAEEDFRVAWEKSGKKNRALVLLRGIAAYAQDRSRVTPEQINGAFRKLPEGSRRAILRELPMALRSDRDLEYEVIRILDTREFNR